MRNELMTVGAFAQASGMTSSALRFYGDSAVLEPAETDPATGYRYYSPAQVREAILIRHLREMGLPLAEVKGVLDADPATGQQLIADHVRSEADRLVRTRHLAAQAGALLSGGSTAVVDADDFARAVRQVATAVGDDPTIPVLSGVFVELVDGAVILTATDRYRLASRSLPCDEVVGPNASAIVAPADLLVTDRRESVTISLGDDMRIDGRSCRTIAGPYPDYRIVFDGLGTPKARLVLATADILATLEAQSTASFDIVIDGDAKKIHFAADTLARALGAGIGPDVMLDITAPDQPVVVRSATDGDFTTLVMPTTPKGLA